MTSPTPFDAHVRSNELASEATPRPRQMEGLRFRSFDMRWWQGPPRKQDRAVKWIILAAIIVGAIWV